MEKNFAETENQLRCSYQHAESGPALERARAQHKEKARGEHNLNVFVSYELKNRLTNLAEKYELSLSNVVRQVIKAGLPVFESLSTSQEELLSNCVQLLRQSRSMG